MRAGLALGFLILQDNSFLTVERSWNCATEQPFQSLVQGWFGEILRLSNYLPSGTEFRGRAVWRFLLSNAAKLPG